MFQSLKSSQEIKIIHWKHKMIKTEVALMLLQTEEFKRKLKTWRMIYVHQFKIVQSS